MANDIYDVRLFWADPDGKRAENVLHFGATTAIADPDPYSTATDVCTQFLAALKTDLLQMVSTTCSLAAISSKRVNNAGGPTATVAVADPGTRVGDTMTNAVALNFCLIPSAAPYRRKEGHFYLGGLVATDVVGDVINGTLLTLGDTWAGLLSSGFTADTVPFVPVIFDRTTKIGTDVSDIVVRPTLTPLKRRLHPRVG